MQATLPIPALLKLLQIASPSLPVGAYSYSQGLEWAVEARWINNVDDFKRWIKEQLHGTMAQQELPLVARLHQAHSRGYADLITKWDNYAIAVRETAELRNEERLRGRALNTLLGKLNVTAPAVNTASYTAGYAQYCVHEGISQYHALHGFSYSWADNLVTAGIKLVPLGQSQAQELLYNLTNDFQHAVTAALELDDICLLYTSDAADE